MTRRLNNMPSQDPLLDSFAEDVIESGHADEVDNPERGCGHLKNNASYVRSDVNALSSPDGDIPRFVVLDDPIEYREYSGRGAIIPGYEYFPGVQFSLAYLNNGHTTTPRDELEAHIDRHRSDRFVGEHYGEMEPARALDLLMSVGETNWATPGEFIEECQEDGLNLRIPASPNKEPPVVNPMRTRCWVIHPNGAGDGRAAIIGYAVLTRTIYTTGGEATADDPDIPSYVEDWAETGKVDLVTPAEPEFEDEEEEESPDAAIGDYVDGGDDPDASGTSMEFREGDAETVEEGEKTQTAREQGDTLVASDKPGRDVEVASDDDDLREFEAATFWDQYDVPIDFATAQNNRIGELRKGSSGTGVTEDTARHFYVLEAFTDGRLERDKHDFLCLGKGDNPDRPTEPAENPSEITCETCIERMERWRVDDGE